MALLTARGRRHPTLALTFGFACGLAFLAQGCRFVDPIIASEEYEVQTEGGTKVTVQLHGGEA